MNQYQPHGIAYWRSYVPWHKRLWAKVRRLWHREQSLPDIVKLIRERRQQFLIELWSQAHGVDPLTGRSAMGESEPKDGAA